MSEAKHVSESSALFRPEEMNIILSACLVMGGEWGKLREHILVKIFKPLSPMDTCCASLMCRSWYNASKDPTCWQNLEFLDYRTPMFNMERNGKFKKILKQILEYRVRGSTTTIAYPLNVELHEDDICFVAKMCPKLKFFMMHLNRFMEFDQERSVCDAISGLKDLEGMDVDQGFISGWGRDDNGDLVTGRVLRSIDAHCPNFTKLSVMFLRMNKLDYGIHSLSRLRTLILPFGNISSWDPLRQILEECKNLSSLYLLECRGTLTGWSEFYEEAQSRLDEIKLENLNLE